MAETAGSLIFDSLQSILQQASEEPTLNVDFQTAVKYMNRMMTGFAANGIALGYTSVSAPNDVITIPDGAMEGVIFNLAIRLSPTYDITPSQDLRISASEGKSAMRKLSRNKVKTKHPSTLPIGSGNEGFHNFNSTHFYPGVDNEVLAETGSSILLEDTP